ncbi:uncharacterized protein LOC119096594 [Pollicipes pollicipes]|uniref:uncharacterized protein LOC119096594 n=1 Tax=Pollicipes pollicipes TaxID=41117 RepID=UPI00188585B4|nr:uncharacterized protein LOC119096594 [Pollicipes pollicipes]
MAGAAPGRMAERTDGMSWTVSVSHQVVSLLADVDGAVARVASLAAPLSPGGRDAVVETVRALADAVTRLRAENKQKTTLLEERTAHLRDLIVTQQKDAARQALMDAEESEGHKVAALDCVVRSRRPSPPGSTPTSPAGGAAKASSRPASAE